MFAAVLGGLLLVPLAADAGYLIVDENSEQALRRYREGAVDEYDASVRGLAGAPMADVERLLAEFALPTGLVAAPPLLEVFGRGAP